MIDPEDTPPTPPYHPKGECPADGPCGCQRAEATGGAGKGPIVVPGATSAVPAGVLEERIRRARRWCGEWLEIIADSPMDASDLRGLLAMLEGRS